MFILRQEHEDAFGKAGLERFAKKAVRMLRQDYGVRAADYDDAALRKVVDECMTLCRDNGLKTERQMYNVIVGGFLRLCGGITTDVESDPKVRTLLNNVVIAPDERSILILEHIESSLCDRARLE